MPLSRFFFIAVSLVGMFLAPAAAQSRAEATDSAATNSGPPHDEYLRNIARQAALDRAGFSPGVIDGKIGPKTLAALREFQAANRLPDTAGAFDAKTVDALGVERANALTTYTLTSDDFADVGPYPTDWNARAKLDRLRYESLLALIAERGHCTKATVERLNPDIAIERLKSGATLHLPFVEPKTLSKATSLEVDLANKRIRALDSADRALALFHCSIAASADKLPSGKAQVVVVAFNPTYSFKPEMWPEVKNVHEPLLIPAGPRNPVGLCWIGLNLPGYGIHGTPQPELIGKTGSHGCIRLANWDAVRLGRMVSVETPVAFVGN